MKTLISISQLKLFFKQKTNLVFWIALGIVLVFDLFVLQRSFSIILSINRNEPPDAFSQLVRVNFSAFNSALDEIKTNQNYVARPAPTDAPFGLAPNKP
jgi:hypothetical protein